MEELESKFFWDYINVFATPQYFILSFSSRPLYWNSKRMWKNTAMRNIVELIFGERDLYTSPLTGNTLRLV